MNPAKRLLSVLVLLAAASVFYVGYRSQPSLAPVPTDPGAVRVVQPAAAPEAPAATDNILYGLRQPLAKPAGAVRIATYNIENLFDDKDDPALSGEYEDKTMTKPDEQCKAAAEAIKRLDADVLALEEVESYEALMWFRDKYLTGLGYEHVVSIDSGDPRGIECSVLSRLPLSDPKVWPGLPLGGTHPDKFGNEPNREAGKPIEFHRSPLRVTVQVAEKPEPLTVTLFVVHYKSGRGGGYWREREAAKTAELVKEYTDAHAGAAVLVLGDFNSQVREQPLKTLIDSGLESAFKDRAGSDPLTTTHSSGRVIDHILLNPAAQARLVPQTRFVLGMPTRPAKADWRTTPPPAGYASDHFPVSIDLQVAEPEHR